jgi:hypothetical protein
MDDSAKDRVMDFTQMAPTVPSEQEYVEPPQLFTADQLASAVAAAVEAHASGNDPKEAALAAIAP